MDSTMGSTMEGAIQHPAFRFLDDGLRGRARVSASRHHVVVSFDREADVRAASDAFRDGGVPGDAMEHHVRDRGYIVLDWE